LPERGIHAQAVAPTDAGGDVDGHFVGAAVPGIVGVTLMPTYGWPVIFVVGGIIPIVIGLMRYLCYPRFHQVHGVAWRPRRNGGAAGAQIRPALTIEPDTRFLLDPEEGSASTRGSPTALFRDGWATVTVLVWLLFVLNLMAVNLLNAWLPMIVQTSGHSVAQGAYAGTLYQLGGSAGGLVIGVMIDRFGLKVLAIMFVIAVPVLAFTGTPGISDSVLLAHVVLFRLRRRGNAKCT